MRIEEGVKLDYSDVLIKPKRSTLKSRQDVELARKFRFKNSGIEWQGVPVFVANMDTTGVFEIAVECAKEGMMTAIHKHYAVEDWMEFAGKFPEVIPRLAVSMGTSTEDLDRATEIVNRLPELQMVMIDVANGYSENFVEFVAKARKVFYDKVLIAGNVATSEMTEELILAGADLVKVGIGPGSVCTTRRVAGVGYPQLSAVIECADSAHGLGGHIIADGGCSFPADFAKAFGAGADFVMAGGVFAGHDESGGDLVIDNSTGQAYKEFYGMSSKKAMEKHRGGVADYRASEGKVVRIPHKGPVSGTIREILGGVRSACTYVGASRLKELSKRTTFVRVSRTTNESLSRYNTSS